MSLIRAGGKTRIGAWSGGENLDAGLLGLAHAAAWRRRRLAGLVGSVEFCVARGTEY
jgi:hypothetical protein